MEIIQRELFTMNDDGGSRSKITGSLSYSLDRRGWSLIDRIARS